MIPESYGWFLVETLGAEDPLVLIIGQRSKQWRPISNQFRGKSFTAIKILLSTVMDNLKESQTIIDINGPKLVLAKPVIGPKRAVHGILMWIGENHEIPPTPPFTWAFSLEKSDSLPQDASLKFVNDERYAPLPFTHFGNSASLTDWLSECLEISDVLQTMNNISAFTADVDFSSGEWVLRSRHIQKYILRKSVRMDGEYIQGIATELPESVSPLSEGSLSHQVLQLSADNAQHALALVRGEEQYVIAWLTSPPPSFDSHIVSGESPSVSKVRARSTIENSVYSFASIALNNT